MRTLTLTLSAMLLAAVANAQTLPKYQATIVGSAPFSPSCFVANLSDTGVMSGSCAGGIVS